MKRILKKFGIKPFHLGAILSFLAVAFFLVYYLGFQFAYSNQAFQVATDFLSKDEKIKEHFLSNEDIKYEILSYKIFNRSVISSATYGLNLEKANKNMEILVELEKKNNWEVVNVVYGEKSK